jgi:NIPSNAP
VSLFLGFNGNMIYELRTYWAAPGKLDNLNARFRNLTLGLFARHNMTVIGFWTPQPITPDTGDLVYLMAYPDHAALTAAWDAFRADPDWQAGRAASEVDGKLAAKVTSVVLQSTDYSPLQ